VLESSNDKPNHFFIEILSMYLLNTLAHKDEFTVNLISSELPLTHFHNMLWPT